MLLIIGIVFILSVKAAPIINDSNDDIKGVDMHESLAFNPIALRYLNEFGYLHTNDPTSYEFETAIKTFQDTTGVEKTGIIDKETMDQMTQPRCGNNDVNRHSNNRGKRFLFVSRWENKVKDNILKLKWFIKTYTKDIPKDQIKKTVKKAFNLWSNQVLLKPITSLTLNFEEAATEEDADITILWAEGDHGDMHKFDGPGKDGSNILAHTFYPNFASKTQLNGDIHFDDYENWHVDNNGDGASFPHVLVHEIGHTLGLGHSRKQQAIMFPIYRKDSMDLDLDDKCAINWNYVGASDLCLFIYMLSEVVPKRIAIERDSTYLVDDNNINDDEDALLMTKKEVIKARLQNTPIPLCRDDNRVRHHYETMLKKRLNFPSDLLSDYGEILCQFFEGLHKEFNTPVTESFHETFRANGVHNYYADSSKFDDLRKSIGERKFNSEFFNWIISEFTK